VTSSHVEDGDASGRRSFDDLTFYGGCEDDAGSRLVGKDTRVRRDLDRRTSGSPHAPCYAGIAAESLIRARTMRPPVPRTELPGRT